MYPSPEVRYAAQLIKRYTTLVAVCCDDAEALLKAAAWPEPKGLTRHRREGSVNSPPIGRMPTPGLRLVQ